jgi:ribose/xylose/arabinose/galactoside ABC-type transport system permease subunit
MDRTLSSERAMAPEPGPALGGPGARSSRLAAARASRLWRFVRSHGILVAFGLLIVAGALLSPYFLTPANAGNVARQASIIGILGVGMTFVILTAGIDLSAGSILGFSAIAFAMALTAGLIWPVAILVALSAGAAVGAINGLGITRGHLQPFIMTLGMLVIARGVTMTIASGKPIPLGDPGREVAWIGSGDVLGIPVPVILFVLIATAAWLTLRYTPFGRHVYAVGDNLEAARLSGISTNRTIFAVYVISGLCAAVSALIVVSRLTAGEPSQGTGYELDAIAIVVIGGTSLFGGEGGIGGTVIGAAIVAAMNNLLNLLGVSPFSQQIVKGLIILGAVYLERRSVKAEGR